MEFAENPITRIRHKARVAVINKLGFSFIHLIFVLVINIRLVIHNVSIMSIILMVSRDVEGVIGITVLIGVYRYVAMYTIKVGSISMEISHDWVEARVKITMINFSKLSIMWNL